MCVGVGPDQAPTGRHERSHPAHHVVPPASERVCHPIVTDLRPGRTEEYLNSLSETSVLGGRLSAAPMGDLKRSGAGTGGLKASGYTDTEAKRPPATGCLAARLLPVT